MRTFVFALLLLLSSSSGRCVDPQALIGITSELVGSPGLHPPPPGPQASVVIWSDGLIVWSHDRRHGGGGPPFFSTYVTPERLQPLLALFQRDRVFDEHRFSHSVTAPDSWNTTMWLSSGRQHTRLDLSYEDTPRWPTGGDPQFRRVWNDLRQAIAALLPRQGHPYPGSPFRHPR